MNDFTKEELKLLGGCVFSKFVASLNDPSIQYLQNDLKKIRDKIESLIDNYCEHESDQLSSSGLITGVKGDINKPFECKKCGEYFM